MKNQLQRILASRKEKAPRGLVSACSANGYVLEATMECAKETNCPMIIEATANQVNQFGGYTGMTPADFSAFVNGIAQKTGTPSELIILGGDHLGPLTWQNETEETAMKNSEQLIRDYVTAGVGKIHIDTSMRVKDDDPNLRLSDEIIAGRAARLAKAAEEAYAALLKKNPDAAAPVYVIGSEVPIPGGAQENEDSVAVTKPEEFVGTLETFQRVFTQNGLSEALKRVIAVVVQPGVEFADDTVLGYDRDAAASLCRALMPYAPLVFEGHSTDYQTPAALRAMTEDGIAILKVGPALTFALREALFPLADIEAELFGAESATALSDFKDVLEAVMLKNPGNWQKHYHGDAEALRIKRRYSYSDRCRYYLPDPDVDKAVQTLVKNLDSVKIPLSLLSQHMPLQYARVRAGTLLAKPEALLKDRVKDCLRDYMYAILD